MAIVDSATLAEDLDGKENEGAVADSFEGMMLALERILAEVEIGEC
jgi:hypothetical protein